MLLLWIVLAVLALLVLLLLVAVVRTILFVKPKRSEYKPVPAPEREAEYAGKLSEMIKYETVSYKDKPDVEKFLGFHRVLEELFPLVHANLEKTEIDGNLLFKWKGESSEKTVVLMSHQDVVPAEGEWKKAPFGGEVSEGRVWGRGAADIKGGVMAFFQACEELLAEGVTPRYDIYLSSSCTEEVGGDGCPKLVAEMKRRGVTPWLVCDEGGAIVDTPIGGCPGSYAMMGVVEKGQGNLEFIARSTGGHSSTPPKNSPIVRLAKFALDIEKHDPLKVEFIPQCRAMFETIAPYGPFAYRLLFGNMWLFAPLIKKVLPAISPAAGALIKTTIAFTMQSGSAGYNVLPQEAKLIANMRFAPHQGMDESIAAVRAVAEKYGLETRLIDGYDYCPPVSTESEAFRYEASVVEKVFPGLPVVPYVMTGGTDARFYSSICDACIRFTPILYGPEQMAGMHGLNECVDTIALPGAVDFYKTLIRDLK